MMKTLWQKIYSFLGFWYYKEIGYNKPSYIVVYWCCFPFWFIRKFDLIRIRRD
jgi:hypothetical protein